MTSNFEIETQQKLNWCWAAVAATVASYFDPSKPIEQCAIAKLALGLDCCKDSKDKCDQPAALETALDAVNTATGQALNNSPIPKSQTFGIIRKQIDSGRPLCARIQWFAESGAHFVMLSGYSISQSGEFWVDVSDPYYEDSTIPYEQFVNAYLDAGEWSDTYLVGQA